MGEMKCSALKLALCAVTVALALLQCAQTAQGVSYVVGNQDSGYTGMFIGQYNEWLVGNPRRISYLFGSLDPDSNLGGICSGSWISWAVIGNEAPGNLDFNCQNSVQDISANVNTVDYYVGGLNLDGVTIAQCYVTTHTNELCDGDTISNSEARQCTTYLKCDYSPLNPAGDTTSQATVVQAASLLLCVLIKLPLAKLAMMFTSVPMN